MPSCMYEYVLVILEYAVQASEKGSQSLEESFDPGRGHRCEGRGHCSADSRTAVFGQTLAPPKEKIVLN